MSLKGITTQKNSINIFTAMGMSSHIRKWKFKGDIIVRFHVLTAESMKIRAFWDTAPCSLGVDRRFRGAYCLHHQGEE
jgi:hypothetical protein